jgi:hypothetical protein
MRRNCLKSRARNCGPLSVMIRGRSPGVLLQRPLHDDLRVDFLHRLADLRVDGVAAIPFEQTDQEVKRARQIEVRDIQVPVLVRPVWLDEAGPLLRRRPPVTIQPAGGLQHAVSAAGTDRHHHVVVEDHQGQAAVAFPRMTVVEVEDRLLLPVLQPPVAGYWAVVLVGLPVTLVPLVELARAQPQPAEQSLARQLGAVRPPIDVIDHFVAGVVGNPASLQSSPFAFLPGRSPPSVRR